jgi:putative FmdB family regulatory protein
MPVYEYDCAGCHKRLSVYLRSVNAAQPQACPECGSADFRRRITGFAFHKSMQTKLDELDPKYEKLIDATSPEISMDSLVKRYHLDESRTDDGRGAPEF